MTDLLDGQRDGDPVGVELGGEQVAPELTEHERAEIEVERHAPAAHERQAVACTREEGARLHSQICICVRVQCTRTCSFCKLCGTFERLIFL